MNNMALDMQKSTWIGDLNVPVNKELSTDVLIVDNENDYSLLLGTYLQSKGYSVMSVDGGSEAKQTLSQQTVRMVIASYEIADLNGLKLISHLQNDSLRWTPSILMAREHHEHLYELAKSAGALTLLYKPFPFEDVLALVQRTLGEPVQPSSEQA